MGHQQSVRVGLDKFYGNIGKQDCQMLPYLANGSFQ